MSTATLTGAEVKVREPQRQAKSGQPFRVVVDIRLPEPWFAEPRWGRKIASVDGRPAGDGLAFETEGERSIEALMSGTLSVRDTRIDVPTPQGFPDAGAGRGVEAVLRGDGGLELRYGHLARGSVRAGRVKAGEALGRSGNTGRCVDGEGRRFVTIEAGQGKRLRDLYEPIRVEASLDGKPVGRAVEVPAGETQVKGLEVARATAQRTPGKKVSRLEVTVRRGSGGAGRVLASCEVELKLEL